MKQYQLRGKRLVEIQPEREISLEYYIVLENNADTGDAIFGAAIKKTDGEATETEEITGIAEERQSVVELIDLMLENTVTPVSMVYVVDDYITEKYCR